MILYELFTGVAPFSDCKLFEVPDKVLAGEKPVIIGEVDEIMCNLINACLEGKPSSRPTCSQITSSLLSYLREVQPKNKKKN